jgi:hypothetical protein
MRPAFLPRSSALASIMASVEVCNAERVLRDAHSSHVSGVPIDEGTLVLINHVDFGGWEESEYALSRS